jgi:hypothetical protein
VNERLEALRGAKERRTGSLLSCRKRLRRERVAEASGSLRSSPLRYLRAMIFERKSDPPGLRSVFRLTAPRYEELESAEEEEYDSWGAVLLEAAFGELKMTDAVSYGREAVVIIEGISFFVHLGIQGPDWLGE